MIPVLEARSYSGKFQKSELFNPKYFLGVRNKTIKNYQQSVETLEEAISKVAKLRERISKDGPRKIIDRLDKTQICNILKDRTLSLLRYPDSNAIVDAYNLLYEQGELALLRQGHERLYEALESVNMGYTAIRSMEHLRHLADGDLNKLEMRFANDELKDAQESHQRNKDQIQEERDEYTYLEAGSVEKLSRSTLRPGNFKFIQHSCLRTILSLAFNGIREDSKDWLLYFLIDRFPIENTHKIHHFFKMIKEQAPTLKPLIIQFVRTIAKEPDLDEYWNTLLGKHLAHKHSFKSPLDELQYYLAD